MSQEHPHASVVMMPPPWWNNNQHRDGFTIDNSVPARVREAFEFSLSMARRSSPIIAVNSVGSTEFDPPPLTKLEQAAWDAACSCLADYFHGHLDEDVNESLRNDAINNEISRRRVGNIVTCGVCGGAKMIEKKPCSGCDGAGKLLISPMHE